MTMTMTTTMATMATLTTTKTFDRRLIKFPHKENNIPVGEKQNEGGSIRFSSNFLASWTRTKSDIFEQTCHSPSLFCFSWCCDSLSQWHDAECSQFTKLYFAHIFLSLFRPRQHCLMFLFWNLFTWQLEMYLLERLDLWHSTIEMKEEKRPNPSENQTQDLWITSHQLRKCGHGFISPM